MTYRDRNVMVITSFGHFLSHFNMLVFPAVVLPLVSRLDLALDQVLALSFWMYLLFGVTALPWGLVADKLGGRALMQWFFAGSGVCGLAAAGCIESPVLLSASLAGLGFFSGIYHPVGLGLISKKVTRIGFAMGINGMFGNLGLAAAPLVAGILTWVWGPWAAYMALGGLNLAGVLVMGLMPLPATEATPMEEKDNGPGRGLIVLLVAMMLGGVAYTGATVILPAYFELRTHDVFLWLSRHLPAGLSANLLATLFTSLIFLLAMFGQYLGGRVAEHRSLPHCYLVFHAVTVPAAFFMAWATNLSLVLLALIYFFFLLGMQPIENTLLSRLIPVRWHHSAFGLKFVFTFGVGALAVHGVRAIEKGFGIEWVFPALSAVSMLLVISILFLIARIRNTPGAMQPARAPAAQAAES